MRPLSPVQSPQRATLSVKRWLKISTHWQSKTKNERKQNEKTYREDFLGGSVVKNLPATPVFLDRGVWQVSKELDTTEGLCTHALQWGGPRFDHWSGKIPHAAGQRSRCTVTTEARRSHASEKPVHCSWRAASAHYN